MALPPTPTKLLALAVMPPTPDAASVANAATPLPAAFNDRQACPACHTPCLPQALVCSHCGRLFATAGHTTDVGQVHTLQQAANPLLGKAFAVRDHTVVTHTILLLIEGQSLTLPHTPAVILGRGSSADNDLPLIDLTPFDATAKGVSRQHVQLKVDMPLTYVTDLNSTNGTWLNGTRLLASATRVLRSGDELSLGQLNVVVRFR